MCARSFVSGSGTAIALTAIMRASKILAPRRARIEVIDKTPEATRALQIVRAPDGEAEEIRERAVPTASGILLLDLTAPLPNTGICGYCRRETEQPVQCLRCKRSLCGPCNRGLCSSGACMPRPQGDGVR
jgi:hypothetical protein